MNITLIGMPGAGKSTVGRLLARNLGYAFLDVDPLIVEHFGAPDLQSVLDALGNDGFLEAEAQVISSLHCDRTVVSPGGSAVLREKGALHLKKLGPVVYLRPSLATLTRRLGNLATRGVPLEPGQTLQDLCAYRAPFYERYADLTVDVDDLPPGNTALRVLEELTKFGFSA